MRRRLLVVLVIAAIVGVLASVAVYRAVSQATAGAGRGATEPIVVAAANLALAETITPQHVKVVPWPKESVPPGAVRTLKEAEGRVVRSSITVGEPLLESKLAPELAGRGGVMPMLVPPGQRGVTIKVDDAIKETGFVLPNSRDDVLVSMLKDQRRLERVAKLILQDVQVLAAGQTVEIRDNKPVQITTVTLSLTPDQAERLALAQQEGKLTLATRNLRDSALVRTAGVTKEALLNDAAPAAPAAAPVVGKASRPPAPRRTVAATPAAPRSVAETYRVSVLRANKPSEQVFVRQDGDWVERNK